MINTQTIRRPMLALIAGSALLLGGAAMPKLSLHNSTMLYVIGEARMALGDHDGGLRMIGSAAGQSDKEAAKTEAAPQPAAEKAPSQKGAEICTRKPAAKDKEVHEPKSRMVAMVSNPYRAHAEKYMHMAKLENFDFGSANFDEAKFEQQMARAAEIRSASLANASFKKVRIELGRRGIAVPPAIPEAPVTPMVIQ